MKIAVVQFPGSNCDQDCFRALADGLSLPVEYVWHKEQSLAGFDAVILPGGFSYGDYLRSGAIARFSPIMRSVVAAAAQSMPVLGICNGFQILCESGLLPGALIRNRDLHFVCRPGWLRVESTRTAFTRSLSSGRLLQLPIAHGEGSYFADAPTLERIEAGGQVVLRYVDEQGMCNDAENPNGSLHHIAGVANEHGNVVGIMPHPDRAWERRLGSDDGLTIFRSLFQTLCFADS